MKLATFRQLITPLGHEALEEAMRLEPLEKDFLRHFQHLLKRYPKEIARGALETAILRREAQVKFPLASKMFFTREALEQASSFLVAEYRAKRFRGYSSVLDLGCSIGSDTLALAALTFAIGIDIDILRLEMAKANAQALALPAHFVQADLMRPIPIANAQAAFFDPARRRNGRRIYTVQDYHPPLDVINAWRERFPDMGVKISPGVDLSEVMQYDAECEFISVSGHLKECVLWIGALKTAPRRATLLPGGESILADESLALDTRLPARYLYEPDPAVIRAGAVTALGKRLHASLLDEHIAYLVSDKLVQTPFARVWEVEDWFPFQLKRLRAYLRERRIGKLVVKKRGSPIEPEDLIRSLRLEGKKERVLFLTRLGDNPIVLVAQPRQGGMQT